jgi:xanthine dehydrogenase accessory factor
MDDWGVLDLAGDLRRRGQAFALATVVWRQGPSSSQQGARAIITADGELRGWIGGACAEPVVLREARQVIADGTPRLLLLGSPGQFGAAVPDGMTVVPIACQSEGALEVYIEPVLPTPRLVVVGRSPMARTLTDLAHGLGWSAQLIDADDFSASDADERAMVVVATQGHGDEEAVEQAVAARPVYLGLVGSHRRGAAVLGYLADRGVPREVLDRVRVPAGLDLGHTPHREIAVAVLAELVQLRAAGALQADRPAADSEAAADSGAAARSGAAADSGAAARSGAAADSGAAARSGAAADSGAAARSGAAADSGAAARSGAAADSGGAEAVDPVCGMTVTAGPASRPVEHAGVTYYFCRAGCRRAFEQDPAAYVKRETQC